MISISINITAEPEDIEALARVFPRVQAALSTPITPIIHEPEPEQKPRAAAKTAKAAPLMAAPIALAPGNVEWRVEIDGLPVRWQLDYTAGKFPAARGQEISWMGMCYRISHLYGTSLKLTSQDADTYQAQGGINGSEVAR